MNVLNPSKAPDHQTQATYLPRLIYALEITERDDYQTANIRLDFPNGNCVPLLLFLFFGTRSCCGFSGCLDLTM